MFALGADGHFSSDVKVGAFLAERGNMNRVAVLRLGKERIRRWIYRERKRD